MYGDMSTVRSDATRLRDLADDMRARARALRRDTGAMQWQSAAATTFRDRIDDVATDLDATARAYDDAADALDAHADAVDAVKQAIDDARAWLSDRLHDAFSLARGVVEGIGDAAETVFSFLGADVPKAEVTRARAITDAIGSIPAAGSRAWLDVAQRFKANGW